MEKGHMKTIIGIYYISYKVYFDSRDKLPEPRKPCSSSREVPSREETLLGDPSVNLACQLDSIFFMLKESASSRPCHKL